MKISEAISRLRECQEQLGDIDLFVDTDNGTGYIRPVDYFSGSADWALIIHMKEEEK